jgi:hypothetical protein
MSKSPLHETPTQGISPKIQLLEEAHTFDPTQIGAASRHFDAPAESGRYRSTAESGMLFARQSYGLTAWSVRFVERDQSDLGSPAPFAKIFQFTSEPSLLSRNVRVRRRNGRHLLGVSISRFDPKPTPPVR